MKFFLTAFFASLIFISSQVLAQDAKLKLGHVNITKVLENHPDYKAAEKKLQDFAAQLQQTLGKMEQEYTTKMQEYVEKEKDMLPVLKEALAKEITDLETRILKLQSSSDQQLAQKQVELLKPLEEKVMSAIKGVAAEKGFTYIFDSSTGSNLLYYPPADDITALVKSKMGVQ